MKNKILQKFLASSIKIKSQRKLIQYINYCIEKNQEKIKGKTSHHHILPKAKSCFPEYSNLKEHPWNGTHLKHSDHYHAHWMLTEAIDNYSQLSAFTRMHTQDIAKKKIKKEDLIAPEEFQKKMENRSIKHSKMLSEIVYKDGRKFSKAQIGAIKGASKRKESYINKEGMKTTSYQEGHKKMAKTRRKIFQLENGEHSSIQKEITKKSEITKDKEITLINGEISTIRKEHDKKVAITKLKQSKFFNVLRKGDVIYSNLSTKDVKVISEALLKTSSSKPLGFSKRSRVSLNIKKKLNLVGLYIGEIINPFK